MKPGDIGMDISIAAHRENGSLIVKVSDTGVGLGLQSSATVFGRGVGLSNIRHGACSCGARRRNFDDEAALRRHELTVPS